MTPDHQDLFTPIRGTRIAHLIESSGPGGAERMVVELALEQSVRGCPTTVFLPDKGDDWLASQLEGSSVVIERYNLDTPLSPQCAREIAAAFRRRNIGLAHSHEFSMAVYGACAARTVRIPHVITMHGGRYYSERMRRRLAMRFAIASSQATVAVSEVLASQMSEDLFVSRAQLAVIPNGVRPAPPVESTLRSEIGIPDGVPLLVAVGSLYQVKGHRYLLEALSMMETDAHLAIAGRGELEEPLRDLAHSLGLSDRVHLLGLRGDIPNLLAAADVFVQPSLSEGLPLALLEAMFAGRPIVSSDVGDVHQAVGEDSALLVGPGDSQGLATAITRLLSDRALATALGENATRRARRAYGLSTMVERYAVLYAPLLQRHGETQRAAQHVRPEPAIARGTARGTARATARGTARRTGQQIERRVERRTDRHTVELPTGNERRRARVFERRADHHATRTTSPGAGNSVS